MFETGEVDLSDAVGESEAIEADGPKQLLHGCIVVEGMGDGPLYQAGRHRECVLIGHLFSGGLHGQVFAEHDLERG